MEPRKVTMGMDSFEDCLRDQLEESLEGNLRNLGEEETLEAEEIGQEEELSLSFSSEKEGHSLTWREKRRAKIEVR